jgi:hypothetical protein
MECCFCKRVIKNKGSLKAHELSCKVNPNRISFTRSKFAGAKKGSVPWNKGTKMNNNWEKTWDEKFPLKSIFVENSSYPRHSLKKRILKNNLLEYKCQICKIEARWQNKPMPLLLDHINGVNNDNRLENLRFICSNCDTQLPTYKSKNRKKECAEVGSSNGLENYSVVNSTIVRCDHTPL